MFHVAFDDTIAVKGGKLDFRAANQGYRTEQHKNPGNLA